MFLFVAQSLPIEVKAFDEILSFTGIVFLEPQSEQGCLSSYEPTTKFLRARKG